MEKKTVGQYITERRKQLGLRQADLGAKLSYSVQAISKMEKGLSQPAGALMPALCNALQVSLEDIYTLNPNPAKENPVPPFDGLIFAQNLAYLRVREGASQYALAAKLGISKRSVTNYERGVSVPSYEVVSAYLSHFNLTPSTLYNTTLTPKAAAKPSIGRRIIWGSIGALAIAAAIVGATSPLWMNQKNNQYQEAYDPNASSSQNDDASSSSSSSNDIQTLSFFDD